MAEDSEFTEPKSGLDGSGDNSRGAFVSVGKKTRRPPTAEAGPSEATNLVSLFSKKEQEQMAQKVFDNYVADVRSRAPRMKKCKEFIEFYASVMKAKSFPFNGAANVNLPILAQPVLQVHARLYDMVWPENGKILYSAPTDISDMGRAMATEKFANSYIRTKMPEMGTGLDDTLAQLCIFGSAFRRTYWNSYEQRVCSDWIPIEDFVVAHGHRSQDPSMRDVPRYTLVQHMTVWDLMMYGAEGIFENVVGLRAEDSNEDGETASELKTTLEKVDGRTGGESGDDDATRMVLEQHCVWRMPNRPGKHPAFDGKPHYVIVTLDEPSKRVLRVVLREEDDPEDLKRYNKELAQIKDFQIKSEGFAREQQARTTVLEVAAAQGLPPPKLPELTAPVAPFGVDKEGAPVEPKKPRQRQITFFTHYRAFPSEGFYGLGFGDFLMPLNKAANTLLNQHIDGVTFRNAKPGFISRQLRTARGNQYVRPGELIEVDAPPDALSKGIVWLDPPLNDPTTVSLVNLISGAAEKLAGSSDIMSGATSGANRTAKEIQILNAQLMKQISVLARRVKEAFKHELDKIWRCWGVFLPEDPEPTPVQGEGGRPEEVMISRQMFVPDARVMPASDPRMKFEKVEESMQVFGVVMNNPMLMQNPMVLRAATEEVLRAHDAEHLVGMMGPPPGPPQPPPPAPHWEEEAGWLREQDHPVHPADDDDQHTQMHMAFLQSPSAQMMSKTGRDMAERHLRFHQAQALEKRAQALQGPPMGPGVGMMGGMGG